MKISIQYKHVLLFSGYSEAIYDIVRFAFWADEMQKILSLYMYTLKYISFLLCIYNYITPLVVRGRAERAGEG